MQIYVMITCQICLISWMSCCQLVKC